MAKISPVSIKYSVTAKFEAEGPLEKPDVIGALFGQTEGLLGSDMELRELQKEGKIGRIEVELFSENGKTKGEIRVPSALDKTETTIIAAALETIDKIGPTDAKITIGDIEDVRGNKRDYIMERAKALLAQVKGSSMDSQEMGEELKKSLRISKVVSYGDEKLPAGDISGKEIIVVEGRADVVNMLRHGINNVIGMNGTKLPAEISKLGEEKELTLFVDGDRGGKLITGNVCANAKIAYITQAPDGKEVEELTSKEIHQALRKKVRPGNFGKNSYQEKKVIPKIEVSTKTISTSEKEVLKKLLSEIKGKNVLVLDESLEIIRNVPASKLAYLTLENIYVLVSNNATRSIVEGAERLGAKYVASQTFGKIPETSVELISL